MADQFIYLALAMGFGLIGAAVANRLKLPAVTGYLVAGLILGLTKVIPMTSLHGFTLLTDLALGFIAFSIGNELKGSVLKKLGRTPIIITIGEAMGAVLVLFLLLVLFKFPLPTALMLSAIGASTAPAATLMVIRQYRADGPVTRMLLPVVAMDNTLALMTFSLAAAISEVLVAGSSVSTTWMILYPVIEIGGSLLAGFVIGFVLSFMFRFFEKDNDRLSLVITAVLLGVGLSTLIHLSALLVCMAAGATMSNLSKHSLRVFKLTNAFTPPLFLIFLVLSGAELNLSMLRTLGFMGIIYVLGRAIGKIGGAYLGSKIAGAEADVQKHIGLTLIPQAGVAIGLSLAAVRILPEFGEQIRVVILSATLIYELAGPVITRLSLSSAGELPDLDAENC